MPKHAPDEDPRITDLRAYRKAREQAQRKQQQQQRKPSSKPQNDGSFLGSNPRAGLILAIIVIVLLLLTVAPRFL